MADIIDPPFPWSLPNRDGMLHCYGKITSTMEKARELARGGCPSMTVVVAETQTQGRGRLDRTWDSRTGGLYFTLVVRPQLPPEAFFRLNFLSSVVLARIFREQYGIFAEIKWPNDILATRKKLVGILSEMGTTEESGDFVMIGIGINVNNEPDPSAPNAVSLSRLLGKPTPRLPLLEVFLNDFEAGLAALPARDVLSDWKALALPMNREVTIVTTGETFSGTAEDIDPDGALILRLSDGTRTRVLYGDCFI